MFSVLGCLDTIGEVGRSGRLARPVMSVYVTIHLRSFSVFAVGNVHVQVFGLQREALLDLELVVSIMWSDIEVLKNLPSSGSAGETNESARSRTVATTRRPSCHTKGRPIQARTPFPKGFQLSGGNFSKPPSSIRSGLTRQIRSDRVCVDTYLNSSASCPQTKGSR